MSLLNIIPGIPLEIAEILIILVGTAVLYLLFLVIRGIFVSLNNNKDQHRHK